ncbi:hypothetical protein [uncultured Alteromonas sp.]|jgi:hypothetical protein|uniref:hypothetical protein n=1 Tax=uncultured Alteromonas sp. TaxID=179113 RepID=UPI0030DD6529|tara:strand:+ start:214 stop:480 length:267 start_codon:yes stop_codon:yes gene_type:complete
MSITVPMNRTDSDYKIAGLVENLISEIEEANLTVDEYCMIAAIGSIAKQLEAFNKLPKVSTRINQYLDEKGYPHVLVGAKIQTEDDEE